MSKRLCLVALLPSDLEKLRAAVAETDADVDVALAGDPQREDTNYVRVLVIASEQPLGVFLGPETLTSDRGRPILVNAPHRNFLTMQPGDLSREAELTQHGPRSGPEVTSDIPNVAGEEEELFRLDHALRKHTFITEFPSDLSPGWLSESVTGKHVDLCVPSSDRINPIPAPPSSGHIVIMGTTGPGKRPGFINPEASSEENDQ